ncbi:MAG: Beta-barrel assembly-enhancing protease [Chlamydiae bacterium]|nr:Beta-barrel assembly-enhancing protease [Chlamydiota bacterium]
MKIIQDTTAFVSRTIRGTVSFGCRAVNKTFEVTRTCFNAVFPKNPVTKSRQFRIIPTSVENSIGENAYDELCPKNKNVESVTVIEVGNRLVKHCDRKELNFEFRVLESDEVNAFCLPGGKICITIGLINKLKKEDKDVTVDDHDFSDLTYEDKLAAVLGHEITHACAAHGAMKMQMRMILFAVSSIIKLALGIFIYRKVENDEAEKTNKAAQELFDMLWGAGRTVATCKHGHSHEYQSDRIGMKYAEKAGYDSIAGIWVQQMFMNNFGSKKDSIALFSSHPPSQRRVEECIRIYKKIQSEGANSID